MSLPAGGNGRIRLEIKTGALWGSAKNVTGCVAKLRVAGDRLARVGTVVDGAAGLIDIELAQVDTQDWIPFSYPAQVTLEDTEDMRANITGIGLLTILPRLADFGDPVDALNPSQIYPAGTPENRRGSVTFNGSVIEMAVTFDTPMSSSTYFVYLTTEADASGGVDAWVKPGTKSTTGFTIILPTADFTGKVYWRVDAAP